MTTPNFALALNTARDKRNKAQQQVATIDEQIDRIIKDAKAAGWTNASIGRHLGISAEAVAKRLARTGSRRASHPPTYGLPETWTLTRDKDTLTVSVPGEREPYRIEPARKRSLGEPRPGSEEVTAVAVRRGYGNRETELEVTNEQHAVLLKEYRKMLRIQANRAAGQEKRKETLRKGRG